LAGEGRDFYDVTWKRNGGTKRKEGARGVTCFRSFVSVKKGVHYTDGQIFIGNWGELGRKRRGRGERKGWGEGLTLLPRIGGKRKAQKQEKECATGCIRRKYFGRRKIWLFGWGKKR